MLETTEHLLSRCKQCNGPIVLVETLDTETKLKAFADYAICKHCLREINVELVDPVIS